MTDQSQPVIPDEAAVLAAPAVLGYSESKMLHPLDRCKSCREGVERARRALAAAAPAIVAANQPKPSDDLRETLTATMQRIRHRALAVEFTDDDGNTVGHMAGGHAAMAAVIALDEFLPLVEAFVAAQCAAARTAALEESLQARCPRVGCPLGVDGDHA
jgi:hypothetical protein